MRRPSDKPAVSVFEPTKYQLNGLDNSRFGDWRFDLNKIEDPVGFTEKLLPKIQVFPFESRRLLLKDLAPDLLAYDPQYRKDSDRYVRLIVYKRGEDKRYGVFKSEYDSRLNAENFFKEFKQNPDLLKSYNIGLQRSFIDHKWVRCGYVKIPDNWIRSDETYGLARFIYSNKLVDTAWQHLIEIAKWFIAPPFKHAFEANFIILTPPLESVTLGGPQILAILTSYNPPGYKPYEHPGFDPRLNDFPNTRPFEMDTWYHPKWGSRIDGTKLNDFCLFLESLVRCLGDYIHLRVGEMPSWSYKCFFTNRFGWIRDHYSIALKQENGDVLAYGAKLKDEFVFRSRSNLKNNLADFIDYLHDQDFFWNLVALIEKVRGWFQIDSPITNFLSFLIKFFTQVTTTYVEYNASFLILFLVSGCSFITFIFEKLIIMGAVGSLYFKYPGFLLWAIFITFIATFGSLAKVIFLSFVFLSPVKYFFWLFFFGLFYLCAWGVKSECSKELLTQNKIPKWMHKHILAPIDKRRCIFTFILPVLTNAVFGLPTFMSTENQRIAAIAILLYYIIYLGVLSLTYERLIDEKNFTPPFLRYFPKFIKRRIFFIKKIKRVDKIRPSFIDKFNLFSEYPLTPPVIHKFLDSIRPKLWLTFFSGLGKILFIVVLFLLVLLAINLEGAIGHPLLTESWVGWFTQYNYNVMGIRLIK